MPGVRLNLSRSGPSVSLGARGLHYTVGMKGLRTTVGIPGSGLSWSEFQSYSDVKSRRAKQGSDVRNDVRTKDPGDTGQTDAGGGWTTNFDSRPVEQLVAASTSELTSLLDDRRKQLRLGRTIAWGSTIGIVLALLFGSKPFAIGVFVFGLIAWPAAAWDDKRRLTVSLDYDVEDEQSKAFQRLSSAIGDLSKSNGLWDLASKSEQRDRKRNAGAGVSVVRKRMSCGFGLPDYIESNVKFPCLNLTDREVFFTPDVVLVVSQRSVASLNYSDLRTHVRTQRFIEEERLPGDAQVVGETWKYVNKEGGPDRRFSNNQKIPICNYGELQLTSPLGLNELIQCSQTGPVVAVAESLELMKEQMARRAPEPAPIGLVTPDIPLPSRENEVSSDNLSVHESDKMADRATDGMGGHAPLFEGRIFAKRDSGAEDHLTLPVVSANGDTLARLKRAFDLLQVEAASLRSSLGEDLQRLPDAPRTQFVGDDFGEWANEHWAKIGIEWASVLMALNCTVPGLIKLGGDLDDNKALTQVLQQVFEACREMLSQAKLLELTQCLEFPDKYFGIYEKIGKGVNVCIARYIEEWRDGIHSVRVGGGVFEVTALNEPSIFLRPYLDGLPESEARERLEQMTVFIGASNELAFQSVSLN